MDRILPGMETMLEVVAGYVKQGFSPVPIKLDGTKRPTISWKELQVRLPQDEELKRWWGGNNPSGIGLIQGGVSGNASLLDFDQPGALSEFKRFCQELGFGALLDRLTLRVRTPSGGHHLYCRCTDGVDGNQKLAHSVIERHANRDSFPEEIRKSVQQDYNGDWCRLEIKIETRGEGGYAIAPGSPALCHPTGNLYEIIQGSFDEVPLFTGAELEMLLTAARACDEFVPKPPAVQIGNKTPHDSDRGTEIPPWEAYNKQMGTEEIVDLFVEAGWTKARRRGNAVDLVRPGKDPQLGISATVGYHVLGVTRIFTSSEPLFRPSQSYSQFQVYANLKHGGDIKAAARELSNQGFGDPPTSKLHRRVQLQKRFVADEQSVVILKSLEQFGLPDDGKQRKAIVTNQRPSREVAEEAWAELYEANQRTPLFFAMSNTIVQLVTSAIGQISTRLVDENILDNRLRRVADWIVIRAGDNDRPVYKHTNVPSWLAKDMLATPVGQTRLPKLRAVTSCPVVTPSGQLLPTPGYDASSEIFLNMHTGLGNIPSEREDACAAMERLKRVWSEFPFATEGDRANAMAMLFTPFLRYYIYAPAPLFMVEAPTQGTGKTLLVETILRLAYPHLQNTPGPSERERGAAEEWNKIIGAVMSEFHPIVFFDNLHGVVSSSTLEALLTSVVPIKIRILGTSKTLEIDPLMFTFVATANNVEFKLDMRRRCTFIRLDASIERPESRQDFRIPDLNAYVRENRGQLLHDVVVVLSAWIRAGLPVGNAHKASFERWAAVVSGVLDFVGIEGFLSADNERAEASDSETLALSGFVAAWSRTFGEQPVTASELVELAIDCDFVFPGPGATRSLGSRLQKVRDRIVGDYRICARRGGANTLRYALAATRGGLGELGGFVRSRTGEKTESHLPEGTSECNVGTSAQRLTEPTKPMLSEDLDDPFADTPGGSVYEARKRESVVEAS